MKKTMNIKKIILLVVSILVFSSCEDSIEGTTNVDPQAAIEIEPDLLMPQVLLSGLTAQRTIESFAMNTHSQQWSFIAGFGAFVNPERYNIGPNTPNNLWVGHFATALRNLDQMRILTERNNPEALNILGQVEVLRAFTFLNLTLIYGDIPFSEATQVVDFPNPNFDSQRDVLLGIPTIIDDAVELLNSPTAIISGSQDLVYGGNRENWIRFGNSIKLKALMLIANVEPEAVRAQIQEVAAQPLITSNSQEAKLDYTTTAGNQNPLWTLLNQFGARDDDGNIVNNFYGGGITLVDLMNANNDPRRASYFEDVDGDFIGQELGVFTAAGISEVSLDIISPDAPDRYITASEVNFMLAEAALLGYITGDANTFYRAGLEASLDYYNTIPGAEISTAERDAFLSSLRGSIASDSQEIALRKIHEETYIADFNRPLETWTDWRRNKVPDLVEVEGATLTDFIRRYRVPLSETTSNPNAPDAVAETEPMYFEK